jgi:hypothetical protein
VFIVENFKTRTAGIFFMVKELKRLVNGQNSVGFHICKGYLGHIENKNQVYCMQV